MSKRILGLGTYPIVMPLHGGQRRVAAFKNYYASLGIDYHYASVFVGAHYPRPFVTEDDYPLVVPAPGFDNFPYAGVPFVDDLRAGLQAETDRDTLRHFCNIVERIEPGALQVEQAFMWPLAKKLKDTIDRKLPIIYSSHNVEAPLKKDLLQNHGVAVAACEKVFARLADMERDCCDESALVICVSDADREHYQVSSLPADIIVVRNGTDRPPVVTPDLAILKDTFSSRPFLVAVGSPYPPNIEGFCDLVVSDGLFCVPPTKSIAVCGGVAHGIFRHHGYQRFLAANSARVHFFPEISDSELWSIKAACHGVLLPICTGGGTNLKTAEAIVLGKWIVATSTAMRGFESFVALEGIIMASDRKAFREAIACALDSPLPEISEASRRLRESLYWDRVFADSGLEHRIRKIL